jgi:predicted transglutaminase-like protease
MQYLKQSDGTIVEFTPTFVTNDKGEKTQVTTASGEATIKADYDKQESKRDAVKKEAQAAYQKEAQAKAIEREAIDEVIREQFAKQIAERIREKKAELANRKNAK